MKKNENSLSAAENETVARIAILAAVADGRLSATELEKITSLLATAEPSSRKRICQAIDGSKASIEGEALKLGTLPARRAAFRVAQELCRADGSVGIAEQAFLVRLTRRLSGQR